MITITEPLLPPSPPMWFVQQADQHRRPVPITAGLTGEQSTYEWLSLVAKTVRRVIRSVQWPAIQPVMSLRSAATWIRERTVVHRGPVLLQRIIPPLLGGGSFR